MKWMFYGKSLRKLQKQNALNKERIKENGNTTVQRYVTGKIGNQTVV